MVLEDNPSASLEALIAEAIERARQWDLTERGELYFEEGVIISFKRKGLKVSVRWDSDPAAILTGFGLVIRSFTDYGYPVVGPYLEEEVLNTLKEKAKDVERLRMDHIRVASGTPVGKLNKPSKVWRTIRQCTSSVFMNEAAELAGVWMHAIQQRLDQGQSEIGQIAMETAETVGIEELDDSTVAAAVVDMARSLWDPGYDLYRWYFTEIRPGSGHESN